MISKPKPASPARTKVRMSDETAVTMPALPSSIRVSTMRLRTGWRTTCSDSDVVKPAPENADLAWKRAACRAMPVWVRATAAMRVTKMDRVTTTRRDSTAIMLKAPVQSRSDSRWRRAGGTRTPRVHRTPRGSRRAQEPSPSAGSRPAGMTAPSGELVDLTLRLFLGKPVELLQASD